MTRISRYPNDLLVSNQDRLVGTDASGNPTRNYRVSDLGNFFKNSFGSFDGVMISALDSRFGVVNDGFSDDWAGLQACADYCSENNYTMYIPYTGNEYIITRPIVPHRTKGLTVYLDARLKNTTTAIGTSTVRGCVFWAGHITHPQQSQVEGLNSGEYLHRIAGGITIGDKGVVVDATLYNAVEAGEIVLVRSDLLSVDRTGEAIPTAGNRRYGVYNYSVLNKIVEKKLSRTGEYTLVFEHPFEETVYEPRIVRFPVGDDTIYVDSNLDDPRLYVGPCENFVLRMSDRAGVETSGLQGFIQATCLYNFYFENINVINATGAFICNSLCYGVINGLKGSVTGPSLAIAFNSTDVRCYGISASLNGYTDKLNQLVRLTETDSGVDPPSSVTITMFNQLGGAIDSSGVIDYNYDAVWYATNNRRNAILYNKTSGNWSFYESSSEMWESGTKPVSLSTDNLIASGWGDSYYIPQGDVTAGSLTLSIEFVIKENRATINIHEGARNIWIEDSNISVASNYDSGDTDINLVGTGLTISKAKIYSNRFVDLGAGASLDSNSISIGNSINKGDIPFNVNDINVLDVTTTGKPVLAVVNVKNCPLSPSQDTQTIRFEGSFAGEFQKLDYNYVLSGSNLVSGAITRAANSTENPEDRYYCYHSTFRNAVCVFSIDGFAGKGKGWYLLYAATVTEPASAGGLLTGVNFGSLVNIYDKDDSFDFSDWDSNLAIYLGEECEYVIFGPCGQFSNADTPAKSITFVPDVPLRMFRGLTFDNIKGRRAALNGVTVEGGVRNLYRGISFERFIPSNLLPDDVPSSRYIVDLRCPNRNYVAMNTFDNISSDDNSYVFIEPIRDQGYSNKFYNILDNRSVKWAELNARFFRQNSSGNMREVFDFSTSAGDVTINGKSGRLIENTTTNFDVLLWEPGGVRTGYSLDIVFTGVSQGQPTINIKALDDGVSTAIHTTDIPNNSDFELFVHIQFLDRLPAPDGTSIGSKVWVSVSHSLRTRTSHTTYTDIVTIDSTGGVKNFTVEVVCENNEQLDLYSYIVEAKTNT
jgi:hypothetical protein